LTKLLKFHDGIVMVSVKRIANNNNETNRTQGYQLSVFNFMLDRCNHFSSQPLFWCSMVSIRAHNLIFTDEPDESWYCRIAQVPRRSLVCRLHTCSRNVNKCRPPLDPDAPRRRGGVQIDNCLQRLVGLLPMRMLHTIDEPFCVVKDCPAQHFATWCSQSILLTK